MCRKTPLVREFFVMIPTARDIAPIQDAATFGREPSRAIKLLGKAGKTLEYSPREFREGVKALSFGAKISPTNHFSKTHKSHRGGRV
jgi:hypothetical protein